MKSQKINKTKLNKAFKQLREMGYFAKQNFLCCQSCGWNAIPDNQSENVVFYNQQDNEDLKETGECYLSWAGNGEAIVETLRGNGIKAEWDGTESDRIKIDLNN